MTETLKVGPLTRSERRALDAADHEARTHVARAIADILADRGLEWPAGSLPRPFTADDGQEYLTFHAKEAK